MLKERSQETKIGNKNISVLNHEAINSSETIVVFINQDSPTILNDELIQIQSLAKSLKINLVTKDVIEGVPEDLTITPSIY